MHNFIIYFKFLYVNKFRIIKYFHSRYLIYHLILYFKQVKNFYPFLNLSNNIDKVIKMIIQTNVAMKPL